MNTDRAWFDDVLAGKNPYVDAILSPDKRYAVVRAANEMKMSHWVYSGDLREVDSLRVIADFSGHPWSTEVVQWSEDSTRLTVVLAKYPVRDDTLTLEFDLPQETVRFPSGEVFPLAEFANQLARYAAR